MPVALNPFGPFFNKNSNYSIAPHLSSHPLPPTISLNMSNQAAYQKTFKSRPFAIESAPMTSPKPHQIVIKTRAIGINPADAAVQNAGLVYAADAHPVILGFDIAGEVHAVGDQVTRFKERDRVCAFSIDMGSLGEVESKLAHGAFQLYCVANEELAARLPENVEFSEAAVFPSCLSTAAWALFTKGTMALDLPPVEGRANSNGKVIIVWGGSSVVGSCAIQMAHLAGYTVIATSSELNFEHCRSLGAEAVFDYKSPTVVDDIVAACRATGKECAGAFVAYYNDDSTIACSQIVSQLGGNKVVGTVVPPQHPVAEGVAEGVQITSSKFHLPDPTHNLHLDISIANTPTNIRLGSRARLHARRNPSLAALAHSGARGRQAEALSAT